MEERDKLVLRAEQAEEQVKKMKEEVNTLSKENKSLEKKLHQVTNKLSSFQSELSEERGLAAALASSQAQWQVSARQREGNFLREIAELKEQLRDVMFFVQARGQLEQASSAPASASAPAPVSREEIAAASVQVGAPPPHKPRRKRR